VDGERYTTAGGAVDSPASREMARRFPAAGRAKVAWPGAYNASWPRS